MIGIGVGVTRSRPSAAEPITDVPAKVAAITPADEAIHIQLDQVISWLRPEMAQSYDVYLGASALTLVLESEGQLARSYVPTLELDSTYFVRIDSVNTFGTTTGDVTSFTTWAEADIWTDGDGVPWTDENGIYIQHVAE